MLHKWSVVGPEFSRLVREFETPSDSKDTPVTHHEQNAATQKKFKTEVLSLISKLEEFGSPFEEDSGDLYSIHDKRVVSEKGVNTLMEVYQIGEEQFKDFVIDRLVDFRVSIDIRVKRNCCQIFAQTTHTKLKPGQQLALALKSSQMFSRL